MAESAKKATSKKSTKSNNKKQIHFDNQEKPEGPRIQKDLNEPKNSSDRSIVQLILGLILVVGGSILFVGAASGWFGGVHKVKLDEEYYTEEAEYKDLDKDEYERLSGEKKSFVVFVDQEGCTTADRLRGYLADYMKEHHVAIYRMMFSELKKSSLHDVVKYYPSVAVISRGKVTSHLRADSDEDADYYNDASKFNEWINQRVKDE